ncbi:hypothetical protein Dip518_000458 [Parelusimicrobium proximum]|uniref:hypothetical protein n=1 Tax=Parelusimicrobium proximum TaxID=3228953 RepID=UPI003D17778E
MKEKLSWLYKYITLRIRKVTYKLRTSFMKRLIAVTKGKGLSHMHSYWPFIRLEKTNTEGAYKVFRKDSHLLTTLPYSELKHKDKAEAFIWGAGPSLNGIDFNKIPKTGHIFLNSTITLVPKYGLKPLAYIILDQFHIIYSFHTLKNIPDGTNLILTLPVIKEIADRDISILLKNKVFLAVNPLEPYEQNKRNFTELDTSKIITDLTLNTAFTKDPAYGFIDGGTVLTLGVQLCCFLGVQNTYIMGMDLSGGNTPHFNEKSKTTYFPSTTRGGLIGDYEVQILPFMQLAAKVFKENGLNIYNCSPVSRLPFDIIPYSDKFAK